MALSRRTFLSRAVVVGGAAFGAQAIDPLVRALRKAPPDAAFAQAFRPDGAPESVEAGLGTFVAKLNALAPILFPEPFGTQSATFGDYIGGKQYELVVTDVPRSWVLTITDTAAAAELGSRPVGAGGSVSLEPGRSPFAFATLPATAQGWRHQLYGRAHAGTSGIALRQGWLPRDKWNPVLLLSILMFALAHLNEEDVRELGRREGGGMSPVPGGGRG